MADPTIEEIQRAIDGATAAGDQRAVDVLTKRQGEIRTQMDASVSAPSPVEVETDALEEPPTEEKPALTEPEPFKLSDRERELATTQYSADQELLNSGQATPSPDQVSKFMGQVMGNTQWSDPNGRELIVDPKTGETRWTAMAPDSLERVTGREKEIEARGSTSKATVGALGYGGTRVVGSALSSAEAHHGARTRRVRC